VSHTNNEPQPWWQVQFALQFEITEIDIWNRIELPERLSPFDVTLYNGTTIAWQQTGISFADTINDGNAETLGMSLLLPSSMVGDRVKVQPQNVTWLHIAEVEAFTPVPEPCTMVVIGGGIVAMIRRRRT
jgi:hypothetical protein